MTKQDMVVTIMVNLFLIEKLFNMTELKKSKSDNVVAVEEWKTDDDPSEYNFLNSNILNL
jgi:hypothetical protein